MKNRRLQEFASLIGKKVKGIARNGAVIPVVIVVVMAVVVVGSYDSSIPEVVLAQAEDSAGDDVQEVKKEKPKKKKKVSNLSVIEEEEEVEETVAIAAAEDGGSYKDGTYVGTGRGFQNGTVQAEVVISGGAIASIRIVSAQYDGQQYLAMVQPLVNQIVSSQSTNVDAVSGATYSSRGVIEAVRNALKQAATDASAVQEPEPEIEVQEPENEPEVVVIEPPVEESGTYKDGTYTGTGRGFQDGEVKAQVTIKKSKISKIKLVSVQYDGDPYLTMAKAVIDQIVSSQSTNVDAVSGATYSSRGIIEAVRDALKQAAVDKTKEPDEPEIEIIPEPDDTPDDDTPIEVTPPEVTEETVVEERTVYCTDGFFFGYDMDVSVFLTDGIVQGIQAVITTWGEEGNNTYVNKAINGIGSVIMEYSAQGIMEGEIDAVSGATYSTKSLVEAVNDALGTNYTVVKKR